MWEAKGNKQVHVCSAPSRADWLHLHLTAFGPGSPLGSHKTVITFLLYFSSFPCLKENEWSAVAHQSSGFSPWSWWCVLLLFSTKTCEAAKPSRIVLEKWWCRGSQTRRSVPKLSHLGRSPAMNHLSTHVQTLLCRQLVGKVQGKARNYLTSNEAVLDDQGLRAGLSPVSLTWDIGTF